MFRVFSRLCLLVACTWSAGSWSALAAEPRYILQANDFDPTDFNFNAAGFQSGKRWYHWLGCDPAVTHLETGIAVDAARNAGRGQRIAVQGPAPIIAVQVKIKRIGNPGALLWEAGSAWGRDDLGKGKVPAGIISPHYEHFVTLPLAPGPAREIDLRFRACSGRCPDDYYAVYCTWKENHPEKALVNSYIGPYEVGMNFRALREDPHGAALDSGGQPIAAGASMMTRLLTSQPGAGRRQMLAGEEEPYAFVESLATGRDPRLAGLPWPDLRPEPGEIELHGHWRIRVAAPKSPQVETAVSDLVGFLRRFPGLVPVVEWSPFAKKLPQNCQPLTPAPARGAASLETSSLPEPRTITLAEEPNLRDGPRRSGGYRFTATSDRVQIQGYDPRGVLRGVWYLEDLMMLRGGPLLKPDARTREPRYSPRATCAAWAGMGELVTPAPVYTDAHLALISHYGYDAIWVGWSPGPERDQPLPTAIAPGRVPQGTTCQPYLPRLRDLTERADRYGLEVVIQYIAPHPASDTQRRALQEQARQFLRDVPKVRTIVLLEEGMGSRLFGMDAWIATCDLLARAFYEVRPDLAVAVWPYNFNSRPGKREDWDRRMEQFCRLDRRVAYMANFDSYWNRRRDGLLQYAYDYCLSLKAPAEDFRSAADYLLGEARRDGQPPRTLYTKIESRFSQESNTQPEIPCMQRWIERYQAVNDFGRPPIKGMIANWYHQGFFPTPVTELYGWWSYTSAPPAADLLSAIARRDFGPAGATAAVAAWAKFSEAIWHFPFYYGLSYTMNAGLAQPFWLDPHVINPRPWRRGFVNSLKAMNLTDSGEGAGSGRENRARLAELQRWWQAGLVDLRKAVDAAPLCTRQRASDHWHNARSFGDKVDMTVRLVRWFDARDKLQQAQDSRVAGAALDALEAVGREELAADKAALEMYLCDSRLGYLNHGRGCATALSILAKIDALEKTLQEELPTLRRAASRSLDELRKQQISAVRAVSS